MNKHKPSHEYDDIIHLERPASSRPRMSMVDRAAQFAPFAALTGYGEAIQEIYRETVPRIILGEDESAVLNAKLRWVEDHLNEAPEITITYFIPDQRKDGGNYHTTTGRALRIDKHYHFIFLSTGENIPIEDILSLEGEDFRRIDK